MQKCDSMKPCARAVSAREQAKTVTVNIKPYVLKLLAKKMVEENEFNRSQLVEYLMICWIYSRGDECDQKCPYFEEKPDAK